VVIALRVEVPIVCFRQSHAREYVETYPVPPPATVYGMLLSLVGEVNRYKHCGSRLAIALASQPQKSTIIRTYHRYKKRNLDNPSNIRPDYQELLTGVNLVVLVDKGSDNAYPSLVERLWQALNTPTSVNRFGGLSLGESHDLVNSVTLMLSLSGESYQWLLQDEQGFLRLPYWVDHVGSSGTRWLRYALEEASISSLTISAWTEIQSS